MANEFGMKCPKCGSEDELAISVQVWAHLVPGGTDADGDHEWDSKSPCRCIACGFEGDVEAFENGDSKGVDPDDESEPFGVIVAVTDNATGEVVKPLDLGELGLSAGPMMTPQEFLGKVTPPDDMKVTPDFVNRFK